MSVELAVPVACPHYLPVDASAALPGLIYPCRGCGAPMTVGPGGAGGGQDALEAGYPSNPSQFSNPSQYEVQ